MNKTQIEWAKNPDGSPGYTWNPITGCLNHDNGLCKGGGFPCYAYKLANGRLKPLYLANKNYITWRNTPIDFYDDQEKGGQFYKAEVDAPFDPFYPRFWEERLTPLHIPRKADSPKKGIFVCDMGELFGDWIPRSWQEQIFNAIKANPDYRFYILTKHPEYAIKFSPFPDNAWVGVTATKWMMFSNALGYLAAIKAKVKYLSFEPLLERIQLDMLQKVLFPNVINWLIIGACIGTWHEIFKLSLRYPDLSVMQWGKRLYTLQPPIEWLREIVEAADKAGIPVFLKDNLVPLIAGKGTPDGLFYKGIWLRQEMPNG